MKKHHVFFGNQGVSSLVSTIAIRAEMYIDGEPVTDLLSKIQGAPGAVELRTERGVSEATKAQLAAPPFPDHKV